MGGVYRTLANTGNYEPNAGGPDNISAAVLHIVEAENPGDTGACLQAYFGGASAWAVLGHNIDVTAG